MLEVSQVDYDACKNSDPIQKYSGGKKFIHLGSAGKRYFICGTTGHCSQGMRIEINTLAPAFPPTDPGSWPPTVGPTFPPDSPEPPTFEPPTLGAPSVPSTRDPANSLPPGVLPPPTSSTTNVKVILGFGSVISINIYYVALVYKNL